MTKTCQYILLESWLISVVLLGNDIIYERQSSVDVLCRPVTEELVQQPLITSCSVTQAHQKAYMYTAYA